MDNNHIFSLCYVHMSFLDARMLDDVDQQLPYNLKSHNGHIAAQWAGLLSALYVAHEVITLLHVFGKPVQRGVKSER